MSSFGEAFVTIKPQIDIDEVSKAAQSMGDDFDKAGSEAAKNFTQAFQTSALDIGSDFDKAMAGIRAGFDDIGSGQGLASLKDGAVGAADDIELHFRQASAVALESLGDIDKVQLNEMRQEFEKSGKQIESDLREASGVAVKELDDVGDKGEKTASRLSGVGDHIKGIIAAAAGFLAVRSLGTALMGAADAAQESAKIAGITEAVITSTGSAAGLTADQIGGLATKLSDLSGVDDELIQSASNVLLTFTNVKNGVGEGADVFTQAQTAALDLSTVMNGDLQGATMQLGKALNDPIKGMTALSRSGVSFTQQQKDQVKALQESGDMLGAQKIILGEVKKEFGGAAEAAASPMDKMKVALGNVQEALGGALLPLIAAVAPAIIDLMKGLTPLIQTVGESVAPVIKILAEGIAKVAPIIAEVMKKLAPALAPVMEVVVKLAEAFLPLLVPLASLISMLVTAFAPVLVTIVDAMTPIIAIFAKFLNDILPVLQPILQKVGEAFGKIFEALGPLIEQALPPLLDMFNQLAVALAPVFDILIDLIVQVFDAIKPMLPELVDAFVQLVLAFVEMNTALLPLLIPLLQLVSILVRDIGVPVLKLLALAITAIATGMTILMTAITDVVKWLVELVLNIDFWKGALDAVLTVVVGVKDAFVDAFKLIVGSVQWAWGLFRQYLSDIGGFFTGMWDAVKGVFDNVIGKFTDLVEFVRGIPIKIADAAKGMFDGIWQAFKTAINFILRAWNAIEFDIPGFSLGPVSFGGFTLGVPDIPLLTMAKGGVVSGSTLAMVGEASSPSNPEVVAPLDKLKDMLSELGGTGEVVVHVYLDGAPFYAATASAVDANNKQLAASLRARAA